MALISISSNTESKEFVSSLGKMLLLSKSHHIIEPIYYQSIESDEYIEYILNRSNSCTYNYLIILNHRDGIKDTVLYSNDIESSISVGLKNALNASLNINNRLILTSPYANLYVYGCIIECDLNTISPEIICNAIKDNIPNEKFTGWIKNELGWWYAYKASNIEYANKAKFEIGSDKLYLGYAANNTSYSFEHTSLLKSKIQNRIVWHGPDGYVVTNTFVKVKTGESTYNVHYATGEEGIFAMGWTLIDGKWHHFSDMGIASIKATIDGTLYTLTGNGALNLPNENFYLDSEGELHVKL